MEFLESIPRQYKVSVVSIAGPYRTGKSFLANRILNQSKGFDIGSTTQACTKGIWLWNKPVPVSNDHVMLLLDTEGLASTERSTNVDIKIFSLSILLSSLFIYNQMGPITETSLEDLSLVANLTSYIHIQQQAQKNKESGVEFRQYFPSFFWVLRDFYHDLENLTPKQYLEECLQPAQGLSNEVIKKNMIRNAITKYFKERECFTMIRPVSDESKLAHIDSLKYEELKTDFRKQVSQFISSVKKKTKVKIVNGKTLNASMFLALTLEYTEAINAKETPTVLTAIDRVIQAETSKIQDETYDQFCHELNEHLHEDNLPLVKEDFKKFIRKTVKQHKLSLQKQLGQILNFQEILNETQKFMQRISEIIAQKYQLNYSASYHYANGVLRKIYENLKNPLENKSSYSDSLALHDYIRNWIQGLKDYKDLAKSINKWEVFCESIVKQHDGMPMFIKRELIDFEQVDGTTMGEEQDYHSAQTSSSLPALHLESQQFALNLFENFLDSVNDLMNDQMNRLKITLTEAQQQEKKLSQKKKQNDQLIELQRQQNEELINAKHDFEMKIENLKRETHSRKQEIESLKQVKDLEMKNLKRNQERQIKDKDDDIKQLENQKNQHELLYQQTQSKVSVLDSEKRKEVSSIQNEIKKLEEDVEELKTKMKNKENNPHFIMVNQFFGEVKEYIQQYKSICGSQEESKKQKQKVFQLQKQLNDMDYKSNQNELKLKKLNDEQLRTKREALERELESYMQDLDQEKSKIQHLQDKRQLYEQQLEQIQVQIQDQKDRHVVLAAQNESLARQVILKGQKINGINEQIKSNQEAQVKIEDKIYLLSIENKQKQEDKEIILMLLPQIYKFVIGKPNNIKGFLNQMENEAIKNKVIKILQAYKIQYK